MGDQALKDLSRRNELVMTLSTSSPMMTNSVKLDWRFGISYVMTPSTTIPTLSRVDVASSVSVDSLLIVCIPQLWELLHDYITDTNPLFLRPSTTLVR